MDRGHLKKEILPSRDSTFQSFTDLTLAFKTSIKRNNVHQVTSQLAAKALLKEDINFVDLSVLNV